MAALRNARPLASTLDRTKSSIAIAKITMVTIRIATRAGFGINVASGSNDSVFRLPSGEATACGDKSK
jgi:hypothetical protein